MSEVQEPFTAAVDTDISSEKPLPEPKELASDVPVPNTTEPPVTSAPVVEPAQTAPTSETLFTETKQDVKPTETAAATTASNDKPTAAPVTSGFLGYKAPGLLKSLIFSKRYFWLGDEPVHHENLHSYLRGEKPEIAHHNAAWSSHTGKGLLYITKLESDKKTPQDIINLAEASHLEKQSPYEFSFRLHNQKHSFKAVSDAERDAWFSSIEQGIEQAKESKQGIVDNDKYKHLFEHLSKPHHGSAGAAPVVASTEAGAAGTKAVESHHHVQSAEPAPAAAVSEAKDTTTPAGDNVIAEKPAQARSSSRNKRTSIFGAFKNKVDDLEPGKKLRKEDKTEVKHEAKDEKKLEKTEAVEPIAASTGVAGTGAIDGHAIAERVIAAEVKTGVSEPIASSTAEKSDVPGIETKDIATSHTTPKPSKRNSIFGNIYQKVRSPASEKKEHEVVPAAPLKDTEVVPEAANVSEPATVQTLEPIVSENPKITEAAPAVASESSMAGTPVVENKPKKDKESLFGNILNKARAKSPATAGNKREVLNPARVETPAATAAGEPPEAPPVPAKDEVPASDANVDTLKSLEGAPQPIITTAPAAEGSEAVAPKEETTTASPVSASTKENRRRSYFGNFGGAKKEKAEGKTEEKSSGKIGSIFRRPSQAPKTTSAKDLSKEGVTLPTTAEPVETEPAPVTTGAADAAGADEVETKPVDSGVSEEKIGDVVPAAVKVGQHEITNPTVSAAA